MRILFVVVLAVLAVPPAAGQIAEGDAAFARRAEGARGARAQATHVDAAIAAYTTAVAQQPNSLEARWKLLRAMRFKSAYVLTTAEQRRDHLAAAKAISEQSLQIVDRALRQRGVPANAGEKKVADAARAIPHAGAVYFWDAVVWGEWALAYGKLAAVRQGAADRIKRSSTMAMLIGPQVENGGGARILGRLHNQTPRVPFLTAWASDDAAVKYLRESLRHDPANKLTKVFLAEALVASSVKNRAEAVALLRDVISTPNDPAYAVEDAAAQEDARALLAGWR